MQVEEAGAGNMRGVKILLRIALHAGQMPGRIEHDDVRVGIADRFGVWAEIAGMRRLPQGSSCGRVDGPSRGYHVRESGVTVQPHVAKIIVAFHIRPRSSRPPPQELERELSELRDVDIRDLGNSF